MILTVGFLFCVKIIFLEGSQIHNLPITIRTSNATDYLKTNTKTNYTKMIGIK